MKKFEPTNPNQETHRFYLEPLGCAKNQVDGEIMISRLTDQGWVYSSTPEDCDLILVNTCGFIQPAKEESLQVSFEFLRDYPDTPVVMTGCLAQRYGQTLIDDIPELAGVFGNHGVEQITTFLDSYLPQGKRLYLPEAQYGGAGEQDNQQNHAATPSRRRTKLLGYPGSAFLKIAEGCQHRCAFCAIPLIRGSLRSLSIPQVLQDFRDLRNQGVKEINLIAQDLASFGLDRKKTKGTRGPESSEFLQLLQTLLAEPGDFWLRPLYLYPETFPIEILQLCKQDPRLLPYFDIPLQHADREILKAMGRPGSRDSALKLIQTIRQNLPECMIRTSLIAGFPGETREHTAFLGEFLTETRIDWVGIFPYSLEEDTRAYDLPKRVPPKEALKRKAALEEIQQPLTFSRLDRFIGTAQRVLVEEVVPGEPLYAMGRTWFQAPEVDGLTVIPAPPQTVKPGDWIEVILESRSGVDMTARPV